MTRFKPSFFVLRLRVERLGKKVYDEKFHKGVNIVRGDNSSGKSTILNLLYYGIGGDVSDWSPIALLCTKVLAEVELNGRVATLAREIVSKAGQPMDVFGGPMEDAILAPTGDWQRYPYRKSETRESFSQALFRLLDLPEATSEASGTVTVHQLLRLMYADQLSPIGTLFKFEQFDPPILRDTVGRLIAGGYENERYANELKLRQLDKEFDAVSSELSSISKLLGQAGQVATTSWLASERARLDAERSSVEAQIAEAEEAIYVSATNEKLSLKAQQDAYKEVQDIQGRITQVNLDFSALKFEIADAEIFIADLKSKLQALQDSSATSDAFSKISYQYCPACYSPIGDDHPAHACHLCKTPYDSDRARARLVNLINDTSRQLRQSESIQRERLAEQSQAEGALKELRTRWNAASKRLSRAIKTPSSEVREKLRDLQRRSGYIDRGLEDLAVKEKMAATLEALTNKKASLNEEITKLKERNKVLAASTEARLSVAYKEIEEEVLALLQKDLPREDSFINAESVQFDFAANRLGVNNESYFSASSRVILRNSFFVGLFAAATKDPSFRHFRFCLLDTIEDKGMQDERSHNFQHLIVSVSQAAQCEHQIIFGTSMIAPDLDIETLTVGHYSTRDKRTLAIAAPANLA